ncbi:hypothetical protein IM511_10275 [Erythrobacteraceae bacterium E2-1 Yellow Sea]|nr:hypothetical protein [Erythrobacteraceae bacterium E2-1 Yellow Sea]
MSKQLAISSAFATFAMAAMMLIHTPDNSGFGMGDNFAPLQVELDQIDLPKPSLIR